MFASHCGCPLWHFPYEADTNASDYGTALRSSLAIPPVTLRKTGVFFFHPARGCLACHGPSIVQILTFLNCSGGMGNERYGKGIVGNGLVCFLRARSLSV
jgi:hypothetical protein